MSCEGAIYKSAGSRSVQAEHKRNARPLDADTALRSIREAEENSKTRTSYTADGLRAWRASSRYRQFSVLNPFPCSCSYPREASRNRAPGKKNHCSISGVFSQGFCFCCCCWWCLALDTWDLQSLPRILEMLETVRAELNLDLIRPFRLVGFPVRDSKHAIPFD